MTRPRKRLAIVGGGSSGLITLKVALDELCDWEIVCFEKTDCITGCWGRPYPGFVSTSTKYTTQFACFPRYEATVHPDGGVSRDEFFCEDEYGKYLEQFAEKFNLRQNIRLRTTIEKIESSDESGWELSIHAESNQSKVEHFDAVVLCTGLASQPKQVDSNVPVLPLAELNSPSGLDHVRGKRIVVIGGGESAVDYAVRLSHQELGNRVFLSLYTGIRVSPRYHPIRGVPSDFLRNRLMLSIHEDLRNWIGQRFVEARINYQEQFESWFPSKLPQQDSANSPNSNEDQHRIVELRKHWAYVLTKAAKDDLFNMFHNKSDGFLDAAARGRIQIVGQPSDREFVQCKSFVSDDPVDTAAELLVPAIGYRSTLEDISNGAIVVRDFYLGCCHVEHPNLFLVGFGRPIIGNIPSISEIQANYVCRMISGSLHRDPEIAKLHRLNSEKNRKQFPKLNLDAIYPVEMFPYCDKLAKLMGGYPNVVKLGSIRSWWRQQLTPATTMHYFADNTETRGFFAKSPVYMPRTLIGLLLLLKPIDWVYRLWKSCSITNRME